MYKIIWQGQKISTDNRPGSDKIVVESENQYNQFKGTKTAWDRETIQRHEIGPGEVWRPSHQIFSPDIITEPGMETQPTIHLQDRLNPYVFRVDPLHLKRLIDLRNGIREGSYRVLPAGMYY